MQVSIRSTDKQKVRDSIKGSNVSEDQRGRKQQPQGTHRIGEYSSANWRRESSCFLGSPEGRDHL